MRILIITGEFIPFAGGAGTYCRYLMKALIAKGHEVTILTKKYDDPKEIEIDEKLKSEGVRCIRMKYTKNTFLFEWPNHIKKHLKENKYDFVILNNNIIHLICSNPCISKLLGNYMVIFHGKETPYDFIDKHFYTRLIFSKSKLKKLYDNALSIVAVSNNLKEYLTNTCGIKNISVITNCIDTNIFDYNHPDIKQLREKYGFTEQDKIIITASRIVEEKGTDKVIKVFKKLSETFHDVKLIIAGDGNYKSRLEDLVDACNIKDKVRFTGKMDQHELHELFLMSNIFILLSKNESFGLVFLEANACRIPVIGSRVDGIPEAIDDGKSGFLVDSDNETEIIDKISSLLHNPALSRIIGEYGEKRVNEKFSIKHLSEKINELLTK